MRIRSIKPEFWRSSDISALAIEDRLLFIGLWSYVDDNGVGVDEPAFITADLFAHDLSVSPHDTLMRVSGGLNRIHERGMIGRYEVDGRRYLHVTNWKSHQKINRPSPGRYPLPDQGVSIDPEPNHGPLSDDSVSAHVPEQGNRGAGEQGNRGAGEESEIETLRPDVEQLLDLLDSELARNGVKRPKRNKANTDAARLLMDRDNYTFEQIAWIIRWCQQDGFWRANIHSMSKLREKFDQLRLQAQRKQDNGKPSRSEAALSFVERLEAEDAASGSGETAHDYRELRQ